MKKIICVLLLLVFVVAGSGIAFAGDKKSEVAVKIISQIPVKASANSFGWDVSVGVVQIYDSKNGVVCYGLAPASESGRAIDGWYPGTSVSCVKVR